MACSYIKCFCFRLKRSVSLWLCVCGWKPYVCLRMTQAEFPRCASLSYRRRDLWLYCNVTLGCLNSLRSGLKAVEQQSSEKINLYILKTCLQSRTTSLTSRDGNMQWESLLMALMASIIHPSIHPPIYCCFHPPIYPYIHLEMYPFIHQSIVMSANLSIHPPVYCSICLSI